MNCGKKASFALLRFSSSEGRNFISCFRDSGAQLKITILVIRFIHVYLVYDFDLVSICKIMETPLDVLSRAASLVEPDTRESKFDFLQVSVALIYDDFSNTKEPRGLHSQLLLVGIY